MKRFVFILLLLSVTVVSLAQRRSERKSRKTPAAPTSPIIGSPSPSVFSRSGVRAYKDVITDKAITQRGLFTVHKVDEKFFFEIADSVLNREIMAITRFVKVPANQVSGGRGTYGGELTNQQTIFFERGPNNNLFIRVVTLVNIADTSNAIFKAVNNSNLNAIAAAFPIAAYSKDSSSVVIDITDFFKGDNQVVSISPSAKRSLNLGILASDRSYISSMVSFPINTEIRTVKTFTSAPSFGGSILSSSPGASVPAATAAGAVTVELNTSMVILPRTPMPIRYWDRRVGFYPENYTVFSDEQQKVDETTFAVRWRLEPKDEDVEKWKRGELVEPIKPIVYYIDPATPKKWRKYLILGVNDWQAAFEKAGFKNAIMAKEWPEDEPAMSMEDARFSVLRYFASDVQNAYGPNVHDPRSGEILESHIGWYHNVMRLVHDWYMVQAGAIDPRARTMQFPDTLMGDLIRFVSSHEVGHTLGLLHNMGSSSKTPVAKLRDKAWVEANGHTASIMDYARFNYVAQPEDNITSKGIYPRIGDYDNWAIRWGYGYIPGNNKEEQRKESNKLIIETLSANPRTYFGTYELGNRNDPRNQREDLGDNPMEASEYGIKNLKRVIQSLPEWTKEDANNYSNLRHMYSQIVGQFDLYLGHVIANIGGVYETPKTLEQPGDVYEATPKALQKQAVAFVSTHMFQTPQWLLNKNILNKINQPSSVDTITTIQVKTLRSLLSGTRLARMLTSSARFGSDVYAVEELMSDVKNSIWSELRNKKPIDLHRRNLQKNYTDILTTMLETSPAGSITFSSLFSAAPDTKNTDLPSIARAYLHDLNKEIIAAIPATSDKMSKYHLIDVSQRIKQALQPKS